MDYTIIDYRDDDISKDDKFNSLALVDKLNLQIEASYGKYAVIGLFGAYGEGKSSIISALKEKLSKNTLEIDAWKYEVKDIENAIHRIYNLEKDMKSISGNIKQMAMSGTKRVGAKKMREFFGFDPSLSSGLAKEYEFYQYNLHKEASFKTFKELAKSWKDNRDDKRPLGLICFENLDRCTIEKKIEVLASIHKLQEWFHKPILVAIDPFAVDKQKKYFEDLVKKVFYTSFYIEQKTAIQIDNYMQSKEEIDFILQSYLNTIYPITPRDINYILNIYRAKHNKRNSDNAKHSYALMAILHSEYRELYHHISINPFILNHYISLAQQNPLCNSFSDLAYSDKDALKINKLFLYFYRNIKDFSIYDVFDFLSPSMKLSKSNRDAIKFKNILHINSEDLKDIISLLLQSNNYYEVKEMLKKCSYLEEHQDQEKLALNTKFILLEIFKYKEMIEILFVDRDYVTCIKNIDFTDSDIKAILNMSANSFGEAQNINLSKFILSIINEDKISKFQKEFAMIFTKHNTLFLTFCKEFEDAEKLSYFIYDIMCDELYDSISSIETSKILNFYTYFLSTIEYIKRNRGNSDDIYINYIFKIFNSIINKSLFLKVINDDLVLEYSKLISTIKQQNFNTFLNLIDTLNTITMIPLDKLRVYYQIINKTEKKEEIDELVFENFVYLMIEIVLENSDEKDISYLDDIVDIICDSSFIMLDKFFAYKDKIAKVIVQILSQSNERRAYDKFSKDIPKVLFTYINAKDFETIYTQFPINNFAINLLNKSDKNDNFFNFLAFLVDNNHIDIWIKEDKEETQNLLIDLANRKNKISYIDKETSNKQIFDRVDFKVFSLDEINEHIEIYEDRLYKFMKEFDTFTESGVSNFNIWLKDSIDENEIKAKLIEDRLYFAFSYGKREYLNSIYHEIFGLYLDEDYSNIFYPLVDRLQNYIREFHIEGENVSMVLEEW